MNPPLILTDMGYMTEQSRVSSHGYQPLQEIVNFELKLYVELNCIPFLLGIVAV